MKLSFKVRLGVIMLIILIIALPAYIYGDVGPKPYVVININGLEGQTYYTTLLSPDKHLGPNFVYNAEYPENARYREGDAEYPIFRKFVDYNCPEGFYFLQNFSNSSESHAFSWSYFPPSEYKVLIYLPQGEHFIISSATYSNYAFATRYLATVIDDDILLTKNYKVASEVLFLIARIVLTIFIEVAIAWLFKIRQKKLIWLIMIVNVITQVTLNILLNLSNFYYGIVVAITTLLLLEIVVFAIEALIYGLTFKRLSQGEIKGFKGVIYALVANSASLLIGFALVFIIPGMF